MASTGTERDERAGAAAASVRALFGRRLFAIPGTYLPHVALPSSGRRGPWHYWWLAHFLDCLLDEADRERRLGSPPAAREAQVLGCRLLRTLALRNGIRFPNRYYDDMGWLLLASQRMLLRHPADACRCRGLAGIALLGLADAVRAGESRTLGGVYWNDRRDYVNAAATGPAALYHARAGDRARAARLLDWLYAVLLDPDTGLILDGVRRGPDGLARLDRGVYTYSQGVVLAALLALGDAASLSRAAALVASIERHLTDPAGSCLLRTHGGHDGGLFTGIAVRYLALAARSPALGADARRRAGTLVRATAAGFWQGRTPYPPRVHSAGGTDGALPPAPTGPWFVFPDRPGTSWSPAARVELSTQVQAWMALEAAATLEG